MTLSTTTTETVELIESHGPKVVIIDSLPISDGEDPLECLAGAQRLHECEVPLPERSDTDAIHQVEVWTRLRKTGAIGGL